MHKCSSCYFFGLIFISLQSALTSICIVLATDIASFCTKATNVKYAKSLCFIFSMQSSASCGYFNNCLDVAWYVRLSVRRPHGES